ncbi:hypothetical protein ACFE04_018543 [Oxalis oulophora]
MLESSYNSEQLLTLATVTGKLHGVNSEERLNLLKKSNGSTLEAINENGKSVKVEVEKVASYLPLHLISQIMTKNRDEALFKYMLSGIQMLASFYAISEENRKIAEILFDGPKVDQVVNLVIYLLIVLGRYRQQLSEGKPEPLLHSALVACSLNLLSNCVFKNTEDVELMLQSHPKVDTFTEVVFGAVNVAVYFLQTKLMSQNSFCIIKNVPEEQIVHFLCHQCEASVQFLQLMCREKSFRERLLKIKEHGNKGGALFLIEAILKMKLPEPFVGCPGVVAAVSRMKARVLEILLNLIDSDPSFLEDIAQSPKSMTLAKSIIIEVFELIRTGIINQPFSKNRTTICPMGLLQLNAIRVADVFSDDSNFQSYMTSKFTELFAATFCIYLWEFLPILCSSDFPQLEEDATLKHSIFLSARWVLDSMTMSFSKTVNPEVGCVPILDSLSLSKALNPEVEIFPIVNGMKQSAYALQRSAFFIKVIANLHCFAPALSQESQKKGFFLNNFVTCLDKDPSKILPGFYFSSGGEKLNNLLKTTHSMLNHAISLTPHILCQDDMNIFRGFVDDLNSVIKPLLEIQVQKEKDYFLKKEKEKGKGVVQTPPSQMRRTGTSRKRARTIMNDEQLTLIEKALVDQPEMQRNPELVKMWAEKLSPLGSEVMAPSQLRSWLYKRRQKKAALAN